MKNLFTSAIICSTLIAANSALAFEVTTIGTTAGITASTVVDCSRDPNCPPYKRAAFVKVAAAEAAEYLNGAAAGAHLQTWFDENPKDTPDEVVNALMKIAAEL